MHCAAIYRQESSSMKRQCWAGNVREISIRNTDVALNDDEVGQGDSEVCTSHVFECPSTVDVP
jgi:hypothetical protein